MKSTLLVAAILIVALPAATQEVTLPLDRYEELWKQAQPDIIEPPEPAAEVAVNRAFFRLRVDDTSMSIIQELDLTLYADGWQKVPIPPSGNYLSVDLGELEGRMNGSTLTIRGQGRHTIRLESAAPVNKDESSARPLWAVSLNLPRAAVVAGEITGGPEIEEINVIGGGVARGPMVDGRLAFAGRPGETLQMNLRGKARGPEKNELPLRFTGSSFSLMKVSQTRSRVEAWLEVRVAQGTLKDLTIRIPEGFEVISADGPMIADWNVDDTDLVVDFRTSIENTVRVELKLTGDSKETFSSPLVVPLAAVRADYASVIAVEGDGLLEVSDLGSARRPSEDELASLPKSMRTAGQLPLVISDPKQPPRWSIEWASESEVLAAQVDRMLVDILAGEADRAGYQFWLSVRSSGAPFLTIEIPADFELVSASRDGRRLTPGKQGHALLVPLVASDDVQIIQLTGIMSLLIPDEGELTIPLPTLSAPISKVEVRLAVPPDAEYENQRKSRSGSVGFPPSIQPTDDPGGRGVAQQVLLKSNAPAQFQTSDFFDTPPSFRIVEATWSALSKSPEPLQIEISPEKSKREWF